MFFIIIDKVQTERARRGRLKKKSNKCHLYTHSNLMTPFLSSVFRYYIKTLQKGEKGSKVFFTKRRTGETRGKAKESLQDK